MDHQDWTPVIFKKHKPSEKQTHVSHATISKVNEKPAWKIEKQIDSDSGPPLNYISPEVVKQIINGRINMKLTQKQLAQRLNMQEKDIKEIESCKAIENKSQIAKIKKVLNIK